MPELPVWPAGAAAVLTTLDADGPYANPVAEPVRAGADSILLSLDRTRDDLGRLGAHPRVALLVCWEDGGFTARGTARVVARSMGGDPDHTAVEILVEAVDDLQREGAVDGRATALRQLVAIRRRCRAAAS
ncbi:pyridoxamine 5'-phosphate oxidase family protein [Spirillospora sp. NPDC048911]|uniref:pyridoxamine 5'-phosphate oxidase family protein n=1 Tax=Spirillospora sp. NPDC048911 TaxID=3364527 RepID=UPI00371E3418